MQVNHYDFPIFHSKIEFGSIKNYKKNRHEEKKKLLNYNRQRYKRENE